MMKCFALLFLLHLSAAAPYTQDLNLTGEIMGRLDRLNDLYRAKKLTFSTATVWTPTSDTMNNASYCVDDGMRQLKDILTNVTLSAEENLLVEVEGNIQDLMREHQQENHNCSFELYTIEYPYKPFQHYINFLRKLHESK